MAKTIILSANDAVRASDSVRARFDSNYLIISNRQKCHTLLSQQVLSKENIIDVLISLHIALEAGLNSLFRDLALRSLKKSVDEFEVTKNVDEISFLHKTTLFIYNSTFDFDGKEDSANKFHGIIGALKEFSGIRNKLIHGHSISTLIEGGDVRQSSLLRSLTDENLKKQIDRFKFIMDGMIFYIGCLDLSNVDKEHYQTEYLDYSFLTQ
jgi:hypothetical protein